MYCMNTATEAALCQAQGLAFVVHSLHGCLITKVSVTKSLHFDSGSINLCEQVMSSALDTYLESNLHTISSHGEMS